MPPGRASPIGDSRYLLSASQEPRQPSPNAVEGTSRKPGSVSHGPLDPCTTQQPPFLSNPWSLSLFLLSIDHSRMVHHPSLLCKRQIGESSCPPDSQHPELCPAHIGARSVSLLEWPPAISAGKGYQSIGSSGKDCSGRFSLFGSSSSPHSGFSDFSRWGRCQECRFLHGLSSHSSTG